MDQPTLDTAGSEDNSIAWLTLHRLEGNQRPIHEYGDFIDNVVKERLERVPGIGKINVYGGSEREIHIIVDPNLLARFQLTVTDLVTTLRNANVSVGAGSIDEGKRRYVVRTEGELSSLEIIRDVLIRSSDNAGALDRVSLSDVATVQFGYKEPTSSIRGARQACDCNERRAADRGQRHRNHGWAESVDQ